MPRASTLHLRDSSAGQHLFLQFQHHSKPWHAGKFTINVIVSSRFGPPTKDVRKPSAFHRGAEGQFRIGGLVHGKDKWWTLTPGEFDDDPPRPLQIVRVVTSSGEETPRRAGIPPAIIYWRPSSFADEAAVFAETISDVSADVRALLVMFGARRP